ncbi:MAG: flagellar hook assembly protein FlgD [Pseudomonadota bacterium]
MTSFDSTLASLGISRTNSAAAKDSANLGNSQMDQGDFLTLMTAQLKNQDPFEPVDNSQMVAQMAQFSSLSGITEMNSTLKAIAERLNGTSNGEAMAWIGRTVLTEGSTAYPRTDGSIGGTIDLAGDATNVTVSIEGPNGAVLKTVDLGARGKGSFDFEWDGTTDTGEAAGEGPFTIKVGARSAAGTPVTATPLVWAPVTSVALGSDGTPVLTLPGLGQVPITAVRKIG